MSVSHGKSRALKRFLRNKFRTPQKQSRSEPQSSAKAAALDKGPAYSIGTDIPQSYNDKYVRVIPRDPQYAFVYWEQPEQNRVNKNEKDNKDKSAEKSESCVDNNKHAVIKIQHTPAFQTVNYPQTICNFGTDNTVSNNDSNQINSHHSNTVAQINPQSNRGSAYVQTPCSGGEIRAEYGVESGNPQKPFEAIAASPAVENSEPTIKQIVNDKKGVDTRALVLLSSVNMANIFSKNISGIDHLSSGELYRADSEKKS
ncbi:MAG: DUF4912 domain-containing protein [Chitinispirillia bacterium]|nr:DUF4912 domain-containing protein [Chitinispirillia bacterium]